MAMMMCTDDEYDHAGCACGVLQVLAMGGDDDDFNDCDCL